MKAGDRIRNLRGSEPSAEVLREASQILARGGLVAFPTRCLYGLGADALSAPAVRRVFSAKQRPLHKPLSILIAQRSDVERWSKGVPTAAKKLMDRFWPGKLTILLSAHGDLPELLSGGTGKIGIRLPAHRVALALVTAFGGPITATSANISGDPGCLRVEDFKAEMTAQLDLVLDAGQLQGGAGSTVVDATGDTVAVLREGVIPAEAIYNCVE